MIDTILVVPDCHVPFHDERALNLVIKVGQSIKPKHLVLLGDFLDCYSVSSFDKDPNRANQFDRELSVAKGKLDLLGKLCKDKVFCFGNHEHRLQKYLSRKAPELYNIVKLEKLLQLKESGWTYVPYMDHYKIGRLFFTHEAGSSGQYAHVQAQRAFEGNVVIGHSHRLGTFYAGNARGKPHVGAHLGWLGSTKMVDYTHRIRAYRDWSLGFGVAYMEPSGNCHIQAVPIIDYRCVVNGRLFVG